MSVISPCGSEDPLRFVVEARGWSTGAAPWQPLRGGRTNRLWRVARADGDLVVKLFTHPYDNPLFRNDPKAEATLLRHLAGLDLGPKLLDRFDTPAGHALVYRHVPGATWQAGAAGVATLLHRVHQTPPPSAPPLPRAPNGSAALCRQGLAILAGCPVQAASELRRDAPRTEIAPSGAARLLHGDPVCANIVGAADRLCLIDWQCPATGDPCEDLALFLSPAMHLAYRGRTLGATEEADFLNAYPAPDITDRYRRLAPWYHWRMAAYCLWRWTRGDDRARAGLIAERKALAVWSATLSEQH